MKILVLAGVLLVFCLSIQSVQSQTGGLDLGRRIMGRRSADPERSQTGGLDLGRRMVGKRSADPERIRRSPGPQLSETISQLLLDWHQKVGLIQVVAESHFWREKISFILSSIIIVILVFSPAPAPKGPCKYGQCGRRRPGTFSLACFCESFRVCQIR